MSNESKKRYIEFGAMADPIRKQVPEIPAYLAKGYQNIADAVTFLAVHGWLAPKVTERIRKRMARKIEQEARK